MVLVAQGLTAALQQPLVEARFAQHLLVPLTVHQELEDVGHRQLQVQGVLEGNRKRLLVLTLYLIYRIVVSTAARTRTIWAI